MTATEPLDRLVAYLAQRDEDRGDRLRRIFGKLTKREQALFREAAVMGWVRGSMAGEIAGRNGQARTEIPRDSSIVVEVLDACLSTTELYPVLARIARRADRQHAAEPAVELELHNSHDPEPDGERIYPGGRVCRRCSRFVAFESPRYRVTTVGAQPCQPGQLDLRGDEQR